MVIETGDAVARAPKWFHGRAVTTGLINDHDENEYRVTFSRYRGVRQSNAVRLRFWASRPNGALRTMARSDRPSDYDGARFDEAGNRIREPVDPIGTS